MKLLVNNKKTKVAIISIATFLLIACISLFFITRNSVSDEVVVNEEVEETINEQPYRDVWLENKKKNKDYVGQIIFDSGLINKPFVQAKSLYMDDGTPYEFYDQFGNKVLDFTNKSGNDVYIYTDWEDMTWDYDDKGGSIFLDWTHSLDGDNLTIYGHYFSTIYKKDPERIKSFTPLEKFLEKENYEENKNMAIVLDNETRHYVLAAVIVFDSTSEEYMQKCQYWRNDFDYFYNTDQFDGGYSNNMIEFINNVKLYETGIELTSKDRTVCLQTCMTPRMTDYEICIFKEVSVDKYMN